ncbi:hypothetical protein PT286_04410 [Neisseriaceae bacterium ESL0693]|nr:hypothetical protein [Neisseriaceae bacterium ESL0693]
MTDLELIDDSEPLENFLMPEEQEVLAELTEEQFDDYLDACSSYEAMKAYLDNPDSPPQAKVLLDLNCWK